MMPDNGSSERSEMRNAANRIAAVGAAQQQLAGDVEKLRTQVHSLLILTVYGIGMSFLIYMALRGVTKAVVK